MADTSESPIFVIGGRGVKQNFYTDRVIREVDVAPTMAVLAGGKNAYNAKERLYIRFLIWKANKTYLTIVRAAIVTLPIVF